MNFIIAQVYCVKLSVKWSVSSNSNWLVKFSSFRLNGLLLGYEKAKLLGDKAPCHLDSSQVSIKIEADFYIFRPKIGNTYKGELVWISYRWSILFVCIETLVIFSCVWSMPEKNEGNSFLLSTQTKSSLTCFYVWSHSDLF